MTSATASESFYNKVVAAATAIATARYLPAAAIVMHPNRWAWVLEALDTATRPLIVLTAQGPFGDVGTIGSVVAEGAAGTFAGLPVYTDANIPINVGLGTEDIVIVARFPDCYLWESELSLQSFDATYAD